MEEHEITFFCPQVGVQSGSFNQTFQVSPWASNSMANYTQSNVVLVNVSSYASSDTLGNNVVSSSVSSYRWCQPSGQNNATTEGMAVPVAHSCTRSI